MNKVCIFILIFISGCSHVENKVGILEQSFSDLNSTGIKFQSGPLSEPESSYGYHISDSLIKEANKLDSGLIETYIVPIKSCKSLMAGINDLKEAAYESSKIAFGVQTPNSELELELKDGPIYKLSIYSKEILGSIILEGRISTSIRAPWVSAAFDIKNILESCKNDR